MGKTVVEQIVEGIANAEGVQTEDLSICLQDHVSTDAIEMLVNHESDSWRLEFETPSHVVEVTGNVIVTVNGERV